MVTMLLSTVAVGLAMPDRLKKPWCVRFTNVVLSADGEEGFPGNLDIHVTYTLSNQNEFIITYHATTDK